MADSRQYTVSTPGGREAGLRAFRTRAEMIEMAREANIPMMITVPVAGPGSSPRNRRLAVWFTRTWGKLGEGEVLYACLGMAKAEAYLLGRIHAQQQQIGAYRAAGAQK